MDEPVPIHIVMRFADGFLSAEDTIAEHRAVIAKHGCALIGKLGKTLGEDHITQLRKQCQEGTPTYLFLVQKVGREYEVHCANVLDVSRNLPVKEKSLVPKYYDRLGISSQIALWFKVSRISRFKTGGLSDYRIASSKKRVSQALRGSMAGLFIIEEGIAMDY